MDDFSLERYLDASPSGRIRMRDDFVKHVDSVNALKQAVEGMFGESDIKVKTNLTSCLLNALVKKAEALGEELPDRVRKRPRKPKKRPGIYSI